MRFDGALLFKLRDTFGLPLSISLERILMNGFQVNLSEFQDTALQHGWTSKKVDLEIESAILDLKAMLREN